MSEWATFASQAISHAVELLAQVKWSDFTSQVAGALAGALGGAWAAQRIAEKSKTRDDLLKEIRATNSVIIMLDGITNTYVGLKKQHVADLCEKYKNERQRFLQFVAAKAAGTVPPRQVYDFPADLQTMKPLDSPIEDIQRLAYSQLSAPAGVLFIIPILAGALRSLNEFLQDRNSLIATWDAEGRKGEDFAFAYFGVRHNHRVDERYSSALDAIHEKTDEAIAFSKMLSDALFEHAKRRRQLLKKMGGEIPQITRLQLTIDNVRFLPAPEAYQQFADMIRDSREGGTKATDAIVGA